jgi:hypothetical protein
MTLPDDKRRKSPVDRFRKIISADQEKETGPTARMYPKRTASPTFNLPKPTGQNRSQSPASASPAVASGPTYDRPAGRGYLPTFWTVASIISLLFNAVLLVFLMGLLRTVGSLNVAGVAPGVLNGLYTNFERMDQAHIKTNIPIQTNIPLDLSVPVQTTTAITLARDVSIPGAHVRINTPLFNIDAPANVTLPAGTSMDVTMSFTLPVQAQVPVSLNVPVDIPVQDTELHPAIAGLQETIRPLYCIVSSSAQSLSGAPLCR